MTLQNDLITRQLLKEELAHNARLGKLVNKLERRIRRLKRKSAAQHRTLGTYRRWAVDKQQIIAVGKAYTSAFGRIGVAVPYVPLSNEEEKKDGNASK